MRVGVEAFVMLAAVLFSLGLYGVVSKKATVMILMSLELMAVAININLVALSRFVTPVRMTGQFFAVFLMVAARSPVRAWHEASFAQSAAYFAICSSVVFGYQRKSPGGLTPIMTERLMLFG